MEDDDEFGDLYTDVLKPFSSIALLPSQPSTTPNSVVRLIPIINPKTATITSSERRGSKSDEKNKNPVHYNSSRKRREDASSGDEQKESTQGRSKSERWTSHKERDYSIISKSSSSSKFNEIEKINNVDASESNKTLEECPRAGDQGC
ncbi:hypothetical protein F3Y22_tig00015339pilonHSYRG00006 [Hibiscus syriacus]|uniref:Uncharacterized protein n=1 Tax=Hibiscus syriacus TaxID=106335 RepID=A0A6A3BYG7_HIBSY|nr:hypothetical protein F3Y22_tig00015339pilonHSYRG00006 [Hibiscus syriacus]